jgi:hypothetical protein
MSSPGLPTLDLEVASRRTEKRVALLAICLAAAAPWLMDPGWEMLLPGMGASGLCWLGFQRAGWLDGKRRIGRVSWRTEGHWLLTDAQGREFEATLRPDTRVAAGLVWLRWNAVDARGRHALRILRGRARSMLLTSGDIPQPQLRRLCVRLRLARGGDPGSDAVARPHTPAP